MIITIILQITLKKSRKKNNNKYSCPTLLRHNPLKVPPFTGTNRLLKNEEESPQDFLNNGRVGQEQATRTKMMTTNEKEKKSNSIKTLLTDNNGFLMRISLKLGG